MKEVRVKRWQDGIKGVRCNGKGVEKEEVRNGSDARMGG